MQCDPLAQEIINFWLGPKEHYDSPPNERMALWLAQDASKDREIKKKYEPVLKEAVKGAYDHWIESSHGTLALIIVLHQFTRCIYRGTQLAYQYDDKALDVCLDGINLKQDQTLTLIERVFFYMPLEHMEDMEMQRYSVSAYHSLVRMSLPEFRSLYESFFAHAVVHYKLIEEFGRFPHRNAILGRESTQAEIDFLRDSGLL